MFLLFYKALERIRAPILVLCIIFISVANDTSYKLALAGDSPTVTTHKLPLRLR